MGRDIPLGTHFWFESTHWVREAISALHATHRNFRICGYVELYANRMRLGPCIILLLRHHKPDWVGNFIFKCWPNLCMMWKFIYTVYYSNFFGTPHLSCLQYYDMYKTCPVSSSKQIGLCSDMHGQRYFRCPTCINCHIAHRLGQHIKMKLLWRYGRELC